MLQAHGLCKAYGAATILNNITFQINDGEHVGLIGPNGAGKSTLLRLLIGAESPDSGAIVLTSGAKIGYLSQQFDAQIGTTIADAIAYAQAEWSTAAAELQYASDALAVTADLDSALTRYEAALAYFEVLGGYEREHRAATILEGLELPAVETPISILSGGQKTRLGLAMLLLGEPDLLLLDEPTNHLDLAALEWLEGFVQQYPRAALIVSHDRTFLDRTVGRVLVLDAETRSLRSYAGGYSAYLVARDQELAAQESAWQDQQAYVARVQSDVARMKQGATKLNQVSTPVGDHDMKWIHSGSQTVSAKLARMAKARERKLERYLTSDERVDRPRQNWNMKLDFGEPPSGGRAVLELEDVGFAYPGGPELFSGLRGEVQYGERIAIVGPNGVGKSTLLRLIAGELHPTQGRLRLSSGVRAGLLAQEHELLDPERSLLDHVMRERPMEVGAARSFLHFFLFGGDSVFRLAGQCSLGERSRLQLALLVLRGCNLLLLDEPLNHLDILAREQFEAALATFEGTVIAVSHDRAFVEHFAERRIDLGQQA